MTDTKTKAKNSTTPAPTQTPEPRQEIVERSPEALSTVVQPIAVKPTVETDFRAWPSNLDLTTPAEKAAAFNAMGPADLALPSDGMLRIVAHRFILIPEEREDEETGETRQFATLVLFDSDGKTFKTSSAWAWRRALAAMQLYTRAEWDAGIPFTIRAKMGQRKRMYHDIRIEAPR